MQYDAKHDQNEVGGKGVETGVNWIKPELILLQEPEGKVPFTREVAVYYATS